MKVRVVAWSLGLLGCGPVVAPPGADAESGDVTVGTETGSSTLGDASGVPPSMTTGTPGDTTTQTSTDSSSDDADPTAMFIQDPDGGDPAIECDIWESDCPRGTKCMPWSNDGGSAWNATRCTPVAEDPNAVGEPCTVEGSGVSGIDDCVPHAMCWAVDPETNIGECVGFCQGSEANPTCADACTQCYITSSGPLILCLPVCDPLSRDAGGDCGAGRACVPTNETFACVPDASGDFGAPGDPCEYVNVCDPGSFCVAPDAVPECAGLGCCTPFCDVSAPDTCDMLLPGTSCVPWFEEPRDPLSQCFGAAILGACLVP